MPTPSDLVQLQTDIDAFVTTYPLDSFLNKMMHSILSRMLSFISGGGGNGVGFTQILQFTSANFTTSTQCASAALDGATYLLFMNENNRFLKADIGEFSSISGGGFQINLPSFDKSKNNYHFYAFII